MKTRFLLLFVFVFASVINSFSQNRNSVWCFGDSAGIDFSSGAPVTFASGMDGRGSCASIADSNGNLLFYANTRATLPGNTTLVWSKNHQLMQNGDSIIGRGWYNELIIVPQPDNDSLYNLFSVGVTSIYGFYQSIINIKANGGLGEVIQKNNQFQSFANVDCLNAIKHGNGRDWWVIFRKSGVSPGTPNNDFYQYLITPSGIGNFFLQSVGSVNTTNLGKISFSQQGNKMAFVSYRGMIELFDYNRCTGMISNPITVFSASPPYKHFWGCEFSPNGNVLYVTISDQTSYLFQFDLTAANIAASIDTLWVTSYPGEAIGGLKRGPDGKIYESGPYTNPTVFVYPYPDSMRNVYNENLGVINFPDSLGTACDFQPYSFYLGGKRTYWGLPNNPDYELGTSTGSICDTLTAIKSNQAIKENTVSVFPNPVTDKLTITTHNNTLSEIILYDIASRKLLQQQFTNTVTLNTAQLAKGMYIYEVRNNKEVIGKGKVVKE